MSLLSIAPVVGATSISVVGGSANTTIGLNSDYRNLQLMLGGSTSAIDRVKLKFSASEAKSSMDKVNGFSQKRNTVQLVYPIVNGRDEVVFNTWTLNVGQDVITTPAQCKEARMLIAQYLVSAEADAFFDAQAVV